MWIGSQLPVCTEGKPTSPAYSHHQSSISSLHWTVILSPNSRILALEYALHISRCACTWTAFIELPSPTFSALSSSKQKSFTHSLNWKMENVWQYASVQYFKGQSSKPHTYACCMNKLWEQWNLFWGRFLKTRTAYNSFPLGAITWWTIKFAHTATNDVL